MTHKTDSHVVAALIALGLKERDPLWGQRACLLMFESENPSIVASAVTALGQLREVEKSSALPALHRVKQRFPALEMKIRETMADIALVA